MGAVQSDRQIGKIDNADNNARLNAEEGRGT
jgi:hypothetical protein